MKLLLIRNDNIGDLVCTTPLIQLLREAYPTATIDLLGNSYNIEVVKHDTRLSRTWFYCKAKHLHGLLPKMKTWMDKTTLLWNLRLQHYDVVIIAVPLFNQRTTNLARWISPKAIYGAMPDRPLSSPLPRTYHPVTIDHNAPHALQVLTYARALGIKLPAPENMSLMLSDDEKEAALLQRTLIPGEEGKPIVGIQLSARRPKQRWSFACWKEFISLILPHARVRLFWSPGSATTLQHPGDDLLATELVSAFPENSLLATPTTNLRELMIAFSGCNFIVGSDGGAMHLAAGLNIPTLTLFGDIDPSVWRPYSQKAYVIASPSDTLEDLPPHEVAAKMLSKLIPLSKTKPAKTH